MMLNDPIVHYNFHCPQCGKKPSTKKVYNFVYKFCKKCNLSWEKGEYKKKKAVEKEALVIVHWIDTLIRAFRK